MARTPKVVEDRREQILDAAMRAFARKGFTRTTNKDIAQEAGITAGLIYHYFESKEAVFRSIVEERSPLHAIRSLSHEAEQMPPARLLPIIVLQVLRIAESDDFVRILRVFLPEAVHNPDIAPLATNVLREVVEFLSHYFSLKIECGEMSQVDASLAAQIFVNSIIGFVLRRQILQDPLALQYTHEQLMESIVSTVLSGLLPR